VSGVGQTPDGYLWVATITGLLRFDGVQFTPFSVAAPGVPAGRILLLLVDRRGRLWVAKHQGDVVCIEQGRASKVAVPAHIKIDAGVRFLMEDAEGGVWISYYSGAVVRIHDGQARSFTEADGLPEGGVCQLVLDGTGRVWFYKCHWVGIFQENRFKALHQSAVTHIAGARSGGVWGGGEQKQLSKFEADGSLATIPIDWSCETLTALHEDRHGFLWLGTREKGLFRCDRTGVATVTLAQQTILNIQEDREGNVWVGTRGGLSQLKPRVAELLTTGSGVPFEGVSSVTLDTAGQLWAIMWPNGEVMRNKGQDWSPLTPEEGWPVKYSRCVASDPLGGVWIGSSYKGLYRWQAGAVTDSFCVTNGLGADWVRSLWVTASGAVWIGTELLDAQQQVIQCLEGGKLRTFRLPLGSGWVRALTIDSAGDCWGATDRGLLLRVHGDRVIDETARMGSEPSEIRCLLGTPDGSLWIGYGGQGLGRLKDGRFMRCRMEHGLRDDYVSHIQLDKSGRLWLAGNRGIFSVREKDLSDFMEGRSAQVWCTTYGRKEGLLRLQASCDSWPGSLSTADGRLIFAMQSGVAIVYAADIMLSQEPPPVVIERVSVNGKKVAAYGAFQSAEPRGAELLELSLSGGHLRLPPGRPQVTFDFTALSLTMSESIGFKYQLQGVDTDWGVAGSRRWASYTQLQPGHYQFKVTACNSDGTWNETVATVELTVEPYWWETVWFQVGGSLSAFGLLGGVVVFWLRRRYRHQLERLEQQQATEKERMRIARDLHDDLGAGLTQISLVTALTQEGAPDAERAAASSKVNELALDLVRSLDEIVWAVRPQNDNLPSLVEYLANAGRGLCEGSDVRCWVSGLPTVPELEVCASVRHNLLMAFREAVNNVLKHAGATELRIRLHLEAGEFTVEIADNGCGFEVAKGEAKCSGLLHIRQRLTEVGGRCEMNSVSGQGTTVRLSFPLAAAARSAKDTGTQV
jgi:signal transduction histidine kinase/ligand-binding sensor domain-containing protein